MRFTTELVKKAWAIRRQAAAKFGVNIMSVIWRECLEMAGETNMKAIEIIISEAEGGFEARFPFKLKDTFRELFPSAKWIADKKAWKVGPRSGKRLAQWKESVEASGFLTRLTELEEKELTEADIQRLQQQLEDLAEELEAARGRKKSLETLKDAMQRTLALVEAKKAELKNLGDDNARLEEETKTQMASVEAILRTAVNLEKVLTAKAKMARVAGKVGRQAKDEFAEGQAVISKEHDQLKTHGFLSVGLSMLAGANFNRPDRDHPNFATMEKILELRPYTPEDD